MTEQPSDEALMAAYVGGDPSAFGQLFARYGPPLTRMFSRDVRPDDAHDLMQQTFLQLHRARNDFRAGAALRPWLYTIARNLLRQLHRRRGRRPETSLDPEVHGEPAARDADPEAAAADRQVRQLLAKLPEAQREVIALHWFEGLSFKEVAQVVGARESAVKVRAHRGYGKLKKLLRDAGVTADRPAAYRSQGERGDAP